MASVKNLASGTLVSGINVGDTTLTVAVGSGTSEQLLAVWPTPPFYITVAPDSPASGVSNVLDSEIMSVTAIAHSSGNIVMTVTRAQRGTTAKAFNANAIVTNAIYADDAVLLGPNGTTESPSPWIQTGDIEDGAVTASKLDYGSIGTYYIFGSTTATTITSWENKVLEGTTCTFSNADVGGVYEIECILTYAYSDVNLGELNFGFSTAGCSVLAGILDYQIGNSAGEGRARNWRYLVQATSASISANVVIITSAASTVTVGGGYMTIRRVG